MRAAKTWLFTSLLLMIGSVCQGGQETHGGNGFVAEFYATFDSILDPRNNTECLSAISSENILASLQTLRRELKITSRPYLVLNEEFVGAINFPGEFPRLVVLSEKHWKHSNAEQKKALVLHEVLHLIGFDDRNYQYSSRVFNCWLEKENAMKSIAETSKIISTCDKERLQSLSRIDLLHSLEVDGEFHHDFYSSILINRQCEEGLALFQKESFLICGSRCHENACALTNIDVQRAESDPLTSQALNFLELILTDFTNEINLNGCGWNLCKDPTMSSQSHYPAIHAACQTKTKS